MKPLNIAHRGGAGLWPENTLYAFREAARLGYDGAELDLQLTSDGALVVFHDICPSARTCRDSTGRPFSGSQRPICEWTYAELQTLDIGRPKPLGPECEPVVRDGERIPLLSDVIAAVRSLRDGFRLFIELKTFLQQCAVSNVAEDLAEATVRILRECGFMQNSVAIGFDWAALIHAKRIAPELACWFTTPEREAGASPQVLGTILPAIAEAGGDGWMAHHADANRDAVQAAHRRGLKLGVWTVNDEQSLRAALRTGVDAIITDRPDRLQRIQKK